MSIGSTANRNDYVGNGSTATYSYSFRIFAATELKVTKRDASNVETVLAYGTDYSVTGVGSSSGGTVVLTAGNLPSGEKLTIRRVIPLKQETDLRNQGDYYREVVEDQFDRQIMISQQQQDEIDRSLKVPETVSATGFDAELPPAISGAASKVIGTNEDGTGLALGPTFGEVSSAQGYALAAAAAQAAAETAKTAAETAATNADTAATTTTTQAGLAATAKTAAETAQAAAATSATNAANSATAAASSATAAATSQTNASSSASAAATSATNAANSATAAAGSASSASTSATSASTSATNAANSATAAATSATNAAASESAAAGYAAALSVAIPTGVGMDYWGTSAPSGWVFASSRTIGSATSGATERANADTLNLFTLLWNSMTNTELPIQDSSGAASTRGASAAADFAANKRLPVPDKRGRVSVGKDDMGGSAASRVTSGASGVAGATLGASGGAQTHTLTTTQMPSHTHIQDAHTHTQNAHGHTSPGATTLGYVAGSNTVAYAGGGSTVTVMNNTTATNQNTTATNQNTGGDGAHNNMQPTIVCNYIVKL